MKVRLASIGRLRDGVSSVECSCEYEGVSVDTEKGVARFGATDDERGWDLMLEISLAELREMLEQAEGAFC